MKNFLIISIVCYSVGMLHALLMLIRRQNLLFTLATWAVSLGFVFHTFSIIMRGIDTNRFPIMLHQEVCSLLAWTVVAYYLCAYSWYRSQVLSLFVLPVVFFFTLAAWLLPESDVATSHENSVLLIVHAASFILSYGAFIITFLAGVMYIIQERELKRKRFGTIFHKLPSLDTCDDLNYKSLGLGFIFLTFGIVTGIIGSRHLDGIYWHGDPSEFLALVTWFIYLLLIHSRLNAGWRGRRAALLSIASFFMVLFSLAGAGYLSGLHLFGCLVNLDVKKIGFR